MVIRRAAAVSAGALVLAFGLFGASGPAGASATAPQLPAAASQLPSTVLRLTAHKPRPNEVTGLVGWGSAINKAVSNKIMVNEKSLAAQGIELTQWGPDPASGKVKIYLAHYSNAARRALVARYGNTIVVARHSKPRIMLFDRPGYSAPSVPSAVGGRLNDSAPFLGGDLIAGEGANCTSGPTVYGNVSGSPFMLTAGHCAQVGFTITTHGATMGKVTNVRFCDKCIDAETVSGNYNPDVYGGVSGGSNPVYTETGPFFPQPNQGASSVVTNDGAYSGEIRGITVEKVNQNVVAQDPFTRATYSLRFMTEAAKGGAHACTEGDSGGPWIQHQGGTNNVLVVGTMEGGNGAGTDCFFDQIGAITTYFNVNV